MFANTPITVAKGDGIGPEIMEATLHILKEGGAGLEIEEIEIGEKVYRRGNSAGIEQSSLDRLMRTKVFLKAPINTPQGGGFKSLNVTTRKLLGLYANVRPCVAYDPYVRTKHPGMDVVIVRENEEDLYAGIEYQHTPDQAQCLKIITRSGCQRIVRYAFEYARRNGRKKVSCFTKDNIMRLTDGLFHRVFDEIGPEYPELEREHLIVDIGAAKLADTPEVFDVIVMPNLYGDILSDVAAQIAGSAGLAGSANIGAKYAMFEAIHGPAPRRAGQNLGNPSGLLLGSVMMLVHIGQADVAERVHNAWLRTIEDGIHTYDIFKDGISQEKAGTQEFAHAVTARLGLPPQRLKPVHYNTAPSLTEQPRTEAAPPGRRELVGVDLFVHHVPADPNIIGKLMEAVAPDGLKLVMISNRGMKVYPDPLPHTIVCDSWRCRFLSSTDNPVITLKQVMDAMGRAVDAGADIHKTEFLYNYEGKAGYSVGQGQ
ncbi:NADP-dependent isocitrate dehydrogenase [Paludibaculum fermentans]|uniref:Isocitrate dehydrogenase [NADP] n=1 Tax=Paludibaculum fermentans TaxID=1473598 RepID=A0A7S7SNR4_PALFE|nr:NADP-dependent isocitrate dehydrogenase [Paludibaculum fermentans]QOY91749.1 NADP-dependent isocitrate dehydrogenase [Paludibaculum fermentans]